MMYIDHSMPDEGEGIESASGPGRVQCPIHAFLTRVKNPR